MPGSSGRGESCRILDKTVQRGARRLATVNEGLAGVNPLTLAGSGRPWPVSPQSGNRGGSHFRGCSTSLPTRKLPRVAGAPSSPGRLTLSLTQERIDDVPWIESDDLSQHNELDHIEPTLPRFVLGYE